MSQKLGVSGSLARAFIRSKLTPLLIAAATLLGIYAVIALPREEEPQIIVPMIDVFSDLPGATPAEVDQRVTAPIERALWEIPGVEYIYSTSSPGRSLVIVRFLVGEDPERALVRLNQKIQAATPLLPARASTPRVQMRSIDDVPVMALTLWGPGYDDLRLRAMAAQLRESLKTVEHISEVTIIGGRPREVSVDLDPAALAARQLDPLGVQQAIVQADRRLQAGATVSGDRATTVEAGASPASLADLRGVVVGLADGAPVHLADVATVSDAGGELTSYVFHHASGGQTYPAVTLSIAKRPGVNAINLSHAVEAKLDTVRGYFLPSDLQVTITRDYGESAAQKSNELLWHMLFAVLSVGLLIWLALGRRESAVVLTAIPVTLALTLFVFSLYGYTLNRITLFALIFSIGILVDDAIVIVENIVRHAALAGHPTSLDAVAVRAVDEVGNPTILATLAVVAAILPMAFVGGLMGPYMRPIPVGASAAMVFSAAVAFIVTPWAAVRFLRHGAAGGRADTREGWLTRQYRRMMGPLIRQPKVRVAFLAGIVLLLLAAASLVPLGAVTVKMLPFDNKSDLQIVVRMPDDTPLETTARAASRLAAIALRDPQVIGAESYTGTSSPYTFNGLVRHYFLRQSPQMADVQVRLKPKDERAEQSHAIAKRLRDALDPEAATIGATIQIVEVPPGPPVLQTLVAEVYGPNADARRALAQQVKATFASTPGVVDVDWYVETNPDKWRLDADADKAAGAGLSAEAIASVVRMAGAGTEVGALHDPAAREPVPIVLRLPRETRASIEALRAVRLTGRSSVAVGEIARLVRTREDSSVYHKNLLPVTYVTGDLAGQAESPVYAILQMNKALVRLAGPDGRHVEIYSTHQPFDGTTYSMKWDGEWHITYEVFRDLGIAFAAVLVLIYMLVVGWFRSLATPLVIMAAIPFSLVGILPAHALMGAFFTATSMIGFIAGAGIVVRNSIILVDFIELRVRDGMPLEDAVVDAGAVRFRPMALTAAAVIVGSGVILFDPIFQGLAVALMAGEVASLVLSRVAVPVLYYVLHNRLGRAPAVLKEKES